MDDEAVVGTRARRQLRSKSIAPRAAPDEIERDLLESVPLRHACRPAGGGVSACGATGRYVVEGEPWVPFRMSDWRRDCVRATEP